MKIKPKIKNQRPIFFKGFSFLEVIIAIFLFSMAAVIIAQTFSTGFLSYRNAKAIQKDLESAQQAVSIIAKTWRTSVVVGTPSITTVRAYDYSQAKCVEYEIINTSSSHVIQTSSAALPAGNTTPLDWCENSVTFSNTSIMTPDNVYGKFIVTPSTSTPKVAGKITIALKICPASGCNGVPKDEARIQTTVSLRNYEEIAP